MKTSPVLLIEFNELCPTLLDRFVAEGQLPHFKRLRDTSAVYVTDAEEEGEKLNPWVQWVTVHTGLSAAEHGVDTLSQGELVAGKNVWDYVTAAGQRAWICGSMNAGYRESSGIWVLPDPWSTGVDPTPSDAFEGFFEFVRAAVQEHSNTNAPLGRAKAIRFLTYMLRHGMRIGTAWYVLRQLVAERFANVHWKRASVMDRLLVDVFAHFWRKLRPRFATFFLNSTAHYQHCYWRQFDPSAFQVKPSAAELQDYAGAIPFGYRAMDQILGRLLQVVGPECTVVFATALSQQPYLKFEEQGGRNYYRVHGAEVLRDKLGLSMPFRYEPVMAEQFYLRFESDDAARDAVRILESFVVKTDGNAAQSCRAFHYSVSERALLVQCNATAVLTDAARLERPATGESVPFFEVFYRLEALKSGRHHPDGALWIRAAGVPANAHPERVTLRSVAPTLLNLLGLPLPAVMSSPPLLGAPQPVEA